MYKCDVCAKRNSCNNYRSAVANLCDCVNMYSPKAASLVKLDEEGVDKEKVEEVELTKELSKQVTSDGSTASYYELPEGATELQHLISFKNMNAQLGEIFRAAYRYGQCSHSDEMREIKKILYYAKAELERLEKLDKLEEGNYRR